MANRKHSVSASSFLARSTTLLCSLLFCAAIHAAEPVDWLLTARYLVPMNPSRDVIEDGAVAVRGERIVAAGPRRTLESQYQPKQRRDYGPAILMPGLINTHAHAPMSLFRGIADDLRLQDWLEHYIFPAEAKNVDPEFVRWGTRLACLEMMLSGTTTYVDMYYFEEVIAEATKEAGLRGVLGQTIIGFPVPDAKTPQLGLERAEAFLKRFNHDPLIIPAVAPHALYTNSDETLKASRALADRYGKPLVIHVSETKKENDDAKAARNGRTPVQILNDLGVLSGRTIAAHCVWLEPQDFAILEQRHTGVAHCPSSNMKLASGVAPILELRKRGIATGLGTDGPAGSNNDFNLMEELNLATNLQKVTRMDPQALPAPDVVAMATIEGARAIGLEGEIGSLEQGKRADIIAVSLTSPHAVPMYNVYSQLVYALKGADIRDVMINGRLILRERKCLTLDENQVLTKAEEYHLKILKSLEKK